MNDRIPRLRAFLERSNNELLTVADIAHGAQLPSYQVEKLLRYIKPAWPNTSEFYDKRDLLKALGTDDLIDDDPEKFAIEEPVPPLGTRCVLEGRK